MSVDQSRAAELWTTLLANEQYADLCEYLQTKMTALKSDLSAFRTVVSASLTEGQCATLEDIIASTCHPPPGCLELE